MLSEKAIALDIITISEMEHYGYTYSAKRSNWGSLVFVHTTGKLLVFVTSNDIDHWLDEQWYDEKGYLPLP